MVLPFRYFLVINGTRFPANPLGLGSAKLKLEKEGENVFFRRKFSGSLIFTNSDFQQLYNLEISSGRCNDVFIEIERFCSGVYQLEWQGVFSLNEVKWNLSLCQATVTPKPNDAYRCVLDHYGKEWNVLDVPATFPVSANITVDGDFEFLFTYLSDGSFDLRGDVATWATFLEIRNWQDGTTFNVGRRANEDVKFRQVTTRPVPATASDREDLENLMNTQGWTYISETATEIKYARQPAVPGFEAYIYTNDDDFYSKYPDLEQWDCGDLPDLSKYIVVNPNGNNCIDIRQTKDDERLVTLIWQFGAFYFNRNRKLLDVVRFLVEKTCPATAPETNSELSDFFTLPINYATGEENKLLNLLISQKSDIINYKSSEAARKGMASLKSIMEGLRDSFNVFWFLNTEGKFQFEHLSYFESQGETDLTLPAYELYLRGKDIYEYETFKMPRYEKLTFSEGETDDFIQGLIEYEGACVNYEEGQDTSEKNVTIFTNDINYLLLSGASANLNGFVLLAHKNGQILSEAGDLTGQYLVNGHLAASNLLKNYHRHGRVLLSGKLNGKTATFLSVQKTKKQTGLTIPGCCDLAVSPYSQYITSLGSNGQLQSAELNLKTNSLTLSIIHETSGSGSLVDNRQFDDSFDLSFL